VKSRKCDCSFKQYIYRNFRHAFVPYSNSSRRRLLDILWLFVVSSFRFSSPRLLFCRRLIPALFRRRRYLLLLLLLVLVVVVVVSIQLFASVGMCHLLIGRLLSRLLLLLPPRTLGKPDTQRYTHTHTPV